MSKVITPIARLSYPKIFDPEMKERGGKSVPIHSATLVFEPGEDISALKQAAFAVVVERFGEPKAKEMLQQGLFRLLGGPHHSIRNDAVAKGYPEGSTFVNSSGRNMPGIVDGQLNPITDPELLYPGAYVRAQLSPFWYEVDGNKGVAWGLDNIQWVRHGERLDGRVAAENAFEAMAPEEFDDLDAAADGANEDLPAPAPAPAPAPVDDPIAALLS